MFGEKYVEYNLNEEEFRILTKIYSDVFYFSKFIKVIHPILGKVSFDLYPFQKSVLLQFLKNRFNIVLKFRQAGITELISMYCLWLAMFHPNKTVVIISIKDRVAKKVLKKIKYMYKNLPEFLQVPVVNGRRGEYGTAQEMVFSNGSNISSIPTTEDAGRSEAVSLLVIDEAAIVRWANQIWAAAFPTLSTGGSAIVNSTPFGVGNWYHGQWVNAVAGGNDFTAIRLYWYMHPERDVRWYNQMRDSLGPRRTAQEIDGDFLTSGHTVFDLADIKAIEDTLSENIPIEVRLNGALRIFERPKKKSLYYLGSDVATGRSRDYSSITIMDRLGEEVVCYKGKISTDKLADLIFELGMTYNRALVAPESNDVGLAVTNKLQNLNYPNLYYSTKILKEKGERKPKLLKIPGWLTTSKNRPVIIDELEQDIRNDEVIIKDPFFVQEAYTFIYDETNRPVALGKNKRNSGDAGELDEQTYTDDAILGKAIANFIRKGKKQSIIVSPQ